MASAQSPKDIVEQWLLGYQAAGQRSEQEMRALRQEIERLDERQLRRFLDWLDARGARHGRAAPTPDAASHHAAATKSSRIAGFGLPRLYGGSPWSLRPRRMKRRHHGQSA